jgi:hypothetical protein
MKMIRYSLLACFIGCSLIGKAQLNISGKIIDSASREPLIGASVFCHNTTIGTATDKKGEFTLQLKSGGYELIISYTGYQVKRLKLTDSIQNPVEIEMIKAEKNMEEVVIRNSNEVADGWEKYGTFFLENFIGATPNAAQCSLQNPEVVKFYYYKRSDKLKILIDSPLHIINKALGYELRYELDSFVYYYKTKISAYRGYCLYTEIEGSEEEKANWLANRKNAYTGSKLHFMRSYYDSTLAEDGFVIEMQNEKDANKYSRVNPYDTTYYTGLDNSTEIEIWYPRKICITYVKKKPEPEYIKKFNLSKSTSKLISYVDLADAIVIKQNGYYYDQKDWVNQGYWSWKNLADQLPYDYEPD